jgi:hypothetical protein
MTKTFSNDLLDPYKISYILKYLQSIYLILSLTTAVIAGRWGRESVMAYEIFIRWTFRGILHPVVQLTLYHNRVVNFTPQASKELVPSENVSRYEIYFFT